MVVGIWPFAVWDVRLTRVGIPLCLIGTSSRGEYTYPNPAGRRSVSSLYQQSVPPSRLLASLLQNMYNGRAKDHRAPQHPISETLSEGLG